jgi:hypothetical protein
MVVFNPTRRMAIILAFVPLMALYLMFTFKIHLLIPSMATWPTQHQIMSHFRAYTRHKLFPWTIKQDKLRDGLRNSRLRTRFRRHIVAVGDLHGDMANARKVLQFSGVVDEEGDWSGDVDFFVQTGDIIDRCALWRYKFLPPV